jgi:hypothetical protein
MSRKPNYVTGWALFFLGVFSTAQVVAAHDAGDGIGNPVWFAGIVICGLVAMLARNENRA